MVREPQIRSSLASTSREVILPPYRFWVTTAGIGSPVVLIHGLGGSSDWWRRNIDALAQRHTVAAVDLVGFGRNRFFLRRSRLPLVFDEMAALLTRWIETTFAEPVHLVGNSMGGHIAIHIAASRPELVASLILVDSTGIPFRIDPRAHLENIVVPRGLLSFSTMLARDLFRAGPTSTAIAFARLLLDDARPLMKSLRMPVLLIWGDTDPLVPLTYAEEIRGLIPQAILAPIPDAGHIPMWENPAAFNRTLLTFLGDVDRSADGRISRGVFTWGVAGFCEGLAHREAGRERDIVLVHGLGMSSSYLVRLARALYERGWNPIAPDLPGFGESLNAPPMSPRERAGVLVRWARALGIEQAVWLGHSDGCNVVAHVAAIAPDLVRSPVFIGPLWTNGAHPTIRNAPRLLIDIFREPPALHAHVIRAYWRTGLARWFRTWLRDARDLAIETLPPSSTVVIGARDPIPDREVSHKLAPNRLFEVPGAHACLFSHPDAVADVIAR